METHKRQYRTAASEFRATGNDGEKRIEGYFAVFGSKYELWPGATESIDPHAFDEALGDDIRCLIDHDTRLVMGRTTASTLILRVDEKGLWGSVIVNEKDTDAMNLYARVERGDVNQCSFGFDILCEEEMRDGAKVHWTIKKVKLYEVSVCTFPAYTETGVEARKENFESIRRRETEEWKTKIKERMDKWHD